MALTSLGESGMVQQSVAGQFKSVENENRPRQCYVTAGIKANVENKIRRPICWLLLKLARSNNARPPVSVPCESLEFYGFLVKSFI